MKSYRWQFAVIHALLILTAYGGGVLLGLSWHSPLHVERAIISNHAIEAEVVANLDGKHVAGVGQYLAGYQCAAWSNGADGTHHLQLHGWVVYYCVK